MSFCTVNQKDVRRVTVLHRSVTDLHDSEGNLYFYYMNISYVDSILSFGIYVNDF